MGQVGSKVNVDPCPYVGFVQIHIYMVCDNVGFVQIHIYMVCDNVGFVQIHIYMVCDNVGICSDSHIYGM